MGIAITLPWSLASLNGMRYCLQIDFSVRILMSAPTAAREISREWLQVSFQEGIDSISHGLNAAAVKNIDPHLVKTHERPHTHPTSDKDLYSILGEVIDRCHASPLLVRYVRQGSDILDLTVISDFHDSIEIAVTKMSAER